MISKSDELFLFCRSLLFMDENQENGYDLYFGVILLYRGPQTKSTSEYDPSAKHLPTFGLNHALKFLKNAKLKVRLF